MILLAQNVSNRGKKQFCYDLNCRAVHPVTIPSPVTNYRDDALVANKQQLLVCSSLKRLRVCEFRVPPQASSSPVWLRITSASSISWSAGSSNQNTSRYSTLQIRYRFSNDRRNHSHAIANIFAGARWCPKSLKARDSCPLSFVSSPWRRRFRGSKDASVTAFELPGIVYLRRLRYHCPPGIPWLAIGSVNDSVNRPFDHWIIQPVGKSTIRPLHHSTNRPFDQSSHQSSNRSTGWEPLTSFSPIDPRPASSRWAL